LHHKAFLSHFSFFIKTKWWLLLRSNEETSLKSIYSKLAFWILKVTVILSIFNAASSLIFWLFFSFDFISGMITHYLLEAGFFIIAGSLLLFEEEGRLFREKKEKKFLSRRGIKPLITGVVLFLVGGAIDLLIRIIS